MAREEVLEVLRKFSSASQQVNRKELGTAIGKIGRETVCETKVSLFDNEMLKRNIAYFIM